MNNRESIVISEEIFFHEKYGQKLYSYSLLICLLLLHHLSVFFLLQWINTGKYCIFCFECTWPYSEFLPPASESSWGTTVPFLCNCRKKKKYIYMKNFTGTRAKIRISLAQVMLTKKVVLLPSKNWKCYRNKEVASHVKGLAMCYAHALTRHAPFHPRAHS